MDTRAKADTEASEVGDLVRAIGTGDKRAEQELAQRYWRGLYFVLFKRLGDQDLAADLTQDSFLIVLRHAREQRIDNPESISGYIRRVGVNVLIEHQRKEKRRNTFVDGEQIERTPAEQRSLLELVGRQQVFELVQQLVGEMSVARDRELLERYYFKHDEKQAICRDFDLSPDAFDKIVHRARQRLKQLIMHRISSKSSSLSETDLTLSIALVVTLTAPGATDCLEPANKQLRGFVVSPHLYSCEQRNPRVARGRRQ